MPESTGNSLNISFEPLFKTYSSKEVIGCLCRIKDLNTTIGYKDGKFWGSIRKGGVTTHLNPNKLDKVIKVHKLDKLMPLEFERFSQK